MEQLLAHLLGDYILQSHWMAVEKTKRWIPAALHGLFYSLPFLFLTQNPVQIGIISLSHMVIDRYRLAVYVVRLKNMVLESPLPYLKPPLIQDSPMEKYDTPTGYPEGTPDWLSVWLMIITDNTLHLLINYFVLRH